MRRVRAGSVTHPHRKAAAAFLLAAAALVGPAAPAHALGERASFVVGNVAVTAALTLVSRAVLGKVRTWRDAAEALAAGAAAGAGFVAARGQIERDRIGRGVALAYLSSSVAENASLGEHPLAFVRWGIGPAELRVATPWAPRRAPRLAIDLEVLELARTVNLATDARRLGVRHGLLYGVVDKVPDYDDDIRVVAYATGRAVGITEPVLGEGHVWRHEAVHVTQAIQFQTFLARDPEVSFPVGVRFGWMDLVVNALNAPRAYEDRWTEREANLYEGDHESGVQWRRPPPVFFPTKP